ncbi:SRPBCC family protein [Streptomyces sp. NPDC050743]|uniref:SRPBCC family protein n=1 Tax=Streptomyces sp. NPDC050743 TaxID=3365634 RepID=UPI0037A78B2D
MEAPPRATLDRHSRTASPPFEGVDYDLDSLTRVWTATNDQDALLVARAHQGIASPAYLPGPYGPTEYQVEAFVNWYVTRLMAHLAR